jgi:hypothetical protein
MLFHTWTRRYLWFLSFLVLLWSRVCIKVKVSITLMTFLMKCCCGLGTYMKILCSFSIWCMTNIYQLSIHCYWRGICRGTYLIANFFHMFCTRWLLCFSWLFCLWKYIWSISSIISSSYTGRWLLCTWNFTKI